MVLPRTMWSTASPFPSPGPYQPSDTLLAHATAPSATSFAAAYKWLAAHTDAPSDLVDTALRSFAKGTLAARSSAWNHWLAAASKLGRDPLLPSVTVLLEAVRFACRSSKAGRPEGSVASLKVTVRRLGDLSATWAALVPPHSLVDRACNALVGAHTTASTLRQPYLDMPRVLRLLSGLADALCADPRAPYNNFRDAAVAAVAATIPSRPSELAALLWSDLTLVIPTDVLGQRSEEVRLNDISPARLDSLLATPLPTLSVIMLLRRAKNDQLSAGIPKRLQHVPQAAWSPSLLLLLLCAARRHSAAASLSPFVFTGGRGPNGRLSPDAISSILADVSKRATGLLITGRGWRPAAASWLLACGVPRDYVAALGGWKSAKSLRNHYVRAVPLEAQLIRSVLLQS